MSHAAKRMSVFAGKLGPDEKRRTLCDTVPSADNLAKLNKMLTLRNGRKAKTADPAAMDVFCIS